MANAEVSLRDLPSAPAPMPGMPNMRMPIGITLETLEIPGAAPREVPAASQGGFGNTQALLDRIKMLEDRLNDLESGAVLSEPETRVKRIEVCRLVLYRGSRPEHGVLR